MLEISNPIHKRKMLCVLSQKRAINMARIFVTGLGRCKPCLT